MDGRTPSRDEAIIKASGIGIATNVLLAGVKIAVGLLSGSIAVVLDAVNNISDALSSVITITGTKLAGRPPDRKHPYGYGRIEYFSTLLIALVITYAGITALKESVGAIMDPTEPDYTPVTLLIIARANVWARTLSSPREPSSALTRRSPRPRSLPLSSTSRAASASRRGWRQASP